MIPTRGKIRDHVKVKAEKIKMGEMMTMIVMGEMMMVEEKFKEFFQDKSF